MQWGGDFAPETIVAGVVQATKQYDVQVYLVGREEQIRPLLSSSEHPKDRIIVVDAPDVVGMGEKVTSAVIRNRNSSMRMAIEIACDNKADAIVSAGNTGAMYAMVKLAVGSLPGIDRLPLAALFPHSNGRTILLDVGANVDCKPHHLVEFALMGTVYAEEVLNIKSPRVGLLSIGEEDQKGNDLTRETFALLKKGDINFTGNVEGHDVFKGTADVIVCDGFTGNVALKVSESLVEIIFQVLRQQIEKSPEISELLTRHFDYSEYGGAPLLGARIPSFVCHGKSTAKAIKNAIFVAKEFCHNGVNERISRKLIKKVS